MSVMSRTRRRVVAPAGGSAMPSSHLGLELQTRACGPRSLLLGMESRSGVSAAVHSTAPPTLLDADTDGDNDGTDATPGSVEEAFNTVAQAVAGDQEASDIGLDEMHIDTDQGQCVCASFCPQVMSIQCNQAISSGVRFISFFAVLD